MEDINTYLDENADGEDRAAAQQLAEGFAALRLQEKVKGAAAARARMQRQARHRPLAALLLMVLVALGSWWWISSATSKTEAPTLEAPTQEETLIPPTETTVPEEMTAPEEVVPQEGPTIEEQLPPPPPNVPIAQAEPTLPPPPYGAPDTYLRGQAEAAEGRELLDQLWYTDYPLTGLRVDSVYETVDELLRERKFTMAYVNLQRLDRQVLPNDTLRYLQAYTLLEMGQGPEALALIDQLEAPAAGWVEQLQWYRGLAHLLDRERAAALTVFSAIAEQARHPYRQQAKKALEIYE